LPGYRQSRLPPNMAASLNANLRASM
jgi:hypothetical protein